MERGPSPDSVPHSGAEDKSRVLNVRPLRCLAPVFPTPHGFTTFTVPQAPPFVYAPPFGPFPPGFTAFYPFFIPTDPQRPPEQHTQTPSGATTQAGVFGFGHPAQTPTTPVPLFRPPAPPQPPQFVGTSNGNVGSSKKSSRHQEAGAQSQPQAANKSESVRSAMEEDGCSDNQKRPAHNISSCNVQFTDVEATSSAEKQKTKSNKRVRESQGVRLSSTGDGDRESLGHILMTFDAIRRRIAQIEDAREPTSGTIKRADLRAGTIMLNNGLRANTRKRIGAVPGVEIGDVYFFRMEMCLVGLHAPCMAGIDYMSLRYDQEEEPVAVSIVSSGAYEDDVDDPDMLVYSGQGGNFNKKSKQAVDQKLERGNLALEKSLRRANEVRVIRGMKDIGSPTGKVYVYDGLYKIQESWMEKGKSGYNVFKYKLVRLQGQPAAFSIWKSIQQWKENITTRAGVILPDLTSGMENLPVSLVNDVDEEKGPAYFTYFPTLKHSKPVSSAEPSLGCNCHGGCQPGDSNCSCIQKNAGDLPYTGNGVLVMQKPLIYECGPSCPCYTQCRNRVSQTGLKVHLEVFKTKDKGWGLRSWDPIRAGTFICEYAGEVIDYIKVEEDSEEEEQDEYIFDSSRTYDNSLKWNYVPELLGEEVLGDSKETSKPPQSVMITAKNFGNVARFMNHSCSPNVFWQPVLQEHKKESHIHIAFYAIRHIPPMTELTYDYGISGTQSSYHRKKKCFCGSLNCRSYFG
ncbi:PREDICTED: histone-lysine N-methyltransferase, H3 lysine-9 specific SUVH1-like [Nelumbo nucifera]|uniref:Histone-lysine N-methyltransferase, H3 lysine-9 specific SUVH1-like n=1 Tax=Nelumbo nucifera TaxID=4432 RepID=A0A1U7ZSG0_NELNU|nr:PREDICTED: histone-lysine N-methyltransferase, H3 lysine-9 specific SUVH1-like [Nelumbo nucifera]XP_010251777.1 PREDICTED: histone-lysine N-methyltransferase, H3 lysine-9 specific SUVH1-like [Nelumbo nucifera]